MTGRLWACDSFKGLPPPVEQDSDCKRSVQGGASCNRGSAGILASSRAVFRHNLKAWGVAENHHRLHVIEASTQAGLKPADAPCYLRSPLLLRSC